MKKENILTSPIITEKTISQEGIGKYTFRVLPDANKNEIRKSVEGIFNTKVDKINIINTKPKKRRRGRVVGIVSPFKKALVTLRKGEKIKIREEKKKEGEKKDIKTKVKKIEKTDKVKKEKKTGVKTRIKKTEDG